MKLNKKRLMEMAGISEGPISPELDRAVKTFVKTLATTFGYDEEDAVYGILESLKRQWKDYMAIEEEGKKGATARLDEGSYVEKMAPDTKELYFKYAKEIDVTDPNKIRDHKQLNDTLKADPAFTKPSQQHLLKQALGWAITFAQQMER